MCLAHGDENDFSDGNGADANERRRIVRWAKKTWLGCLEFYEKHSIRPVFSAVSEDAVRRIRRGFLVGALHKSVDFGAISIVGIG